ncbi:hypothetical protein JCM6882_005753 [Rhodosporidiobolus microsporus]
MASLASLPPELKGAIAREVKLADEANCGEDGRQTVFKSLASLGRVNRAWNTVVKPIQWEHFDLSNHSTESLLTFVRDFLPSISPFIRCLAWQRMHILAASPEHISEPGPVSAGFEQTLSPYELPLVEQVEALSGHQPSGNARLRRLRAVEQLVALIVRGCPRLRDAEFDTADLLQHFVGPGGVEIAHGFKEAAQHALFAHAPQLRRLKVTFYHGVRDKNVLPLLNACTHLKELDLRDCGMLDQHVASEAYHSFLRDVFALPRLRKLKLFLHLPPPGHDIPVSAPIEDLELQGRRGTSFDVFEPFISRCGDTLRALKLHNLTLPSDSRGVQIYQRLSSASSASTPPLRLPHLNHLTLSCTIPPHAFLRFLECPLVTLRIGHFTQLALGGQDEVEGLSRFVCSAVALGPSILLKMVSNGRPGDEVRSLVRQLEALRFAPTAKFIADNTPFTTDNFDQVSWVGLGAEHDNADDVVGS